MFPSSYHSSRSKPVDSIQSFDDQDLSTVQFWMLIGNDTLKIVLVGRLHRLLAFSGVLISFLIVIFMVSSLLLYDKLSVKNNDHFHREQTRRLKDFQVSRSIERTNERSLRCSRSYFAGTGWSSAGIAWSSLDSNEWIYFRSMETWKK